MAKTTGLGAVITIDNSSGTPVAISNDVLDFQFSTPMAVQDVTGVDKSAHERLLLLADASATFNGVFNSAASQSHSVFSDVASTRVTRTVKIQPTSGSTPYLQMEMLLTDYAINRSNTGELTWSVPAALQDGTSPTWS
jgi:hypothetical protein